MVGAEYRVMSEAPWPAQIQDVKANIRWMRANHEMLGIDPSLIVVAGKSAGGHLALLAAGTPDAPEFEGDGGNSGISSEVTAVIGSSPVFRHKRNGEKSGVGADVRGQPFRRVDRRRQPHDLRQ